MFFGLYKYVIMNSFDLIYNNDINNVKFLIKKWKLNINIFVDW